MLADRHKRSFLHRIVSSDEKWNFDNPKEDETIETTWLCFNIFIEKNSGCVFSGINLVSSIMNCSNQTKSLLGFSIEHNWWYRAKYSAKNAFTTTSNTRNFSPIYYDVRIEPFQTLIWDVLPISVFSRHCSFRLSIIPIKVFQRNTWLEDTKNWVYWMDSKDDAVSLCCPKDNKKVVDNTLNEI